MKKNRIKYLCALGLMLGGCNSNAVGPVIKIPCNSAINGDACQNKIIYSQNVNAFFRSKTNINASYLYPSLIDSTFIFDSQSPALKFYVCNPEKLKGLKLTPPTSYASPQFIFKVNIRQACDDVLTTFQPPYYADIISIEQTP